MPTADAVLEANRTATGDTPAAGTAEFDYAHTSSGLTGPAVMRFDLISGAYVETQEAAGIRNADGYDGHLPWQMDISGTYTFQAGGDRIPMAVNAAYRRANLWWRPDHAGAQIAYIGRETVNGRATDRLSVTPRGGRRFDAWFDADNHLLAKIVYDQQFFHITETYSDYRRERGLMLAHKVVADPGLGAGAIETFVLTKVSFRRAQPPSTYAMPNLPPKGADVAGGRTTVPFQLLNNHIYLEARVNGKGPYTFMLDSGGHTLLSPELVKQQGLKAVGESVTSGAGSGHGTSGFVHFDEIAIGGMRMTNQIGFATEIYDSSIEGIRVDGMVGYELIRRMVTTIDYGQKLITFTDPARFKPSKDLGVAVPFLFYDHLPNVAGSVSGLPARFDIDTGSRSEIDFTSPFVKSHDLKSHFAKGVSAVTGWGVGGPSRSYVARVAAVNLGPMQVTNVAAGLSEDRAGSIADPNYDGNVGSGLLKRFVVTLDYAHQLMYLKPIVPTPPDVGNFDRSGLWINAKDGGYAVVEVAKGSAGTIAGIEVGDVIVAMNGKQAVAGQLPAARRLLREQPAGSKVSLTIRRQNAIRSVTLVLKDQI